MRVALAQMRMSENAEDNLKASVCYIEQAASAGADVILFPELQLTPFFPASSGANVSNYLMTSDGNEVTAIRKACANNRLSASINLYLKEHNKCYDASIMIGKTGDLIGISKMVHIASFPHFYEAEYYTPSDTGFRVYDVRTNDSTVKVGVVICFDRHFPESIRSCAVQGAELILIPTANLTTEPAEMFLWELRVQAMQNSVAVCMCNRVGEENGLTFCGNSVMIDSGGEVLYYADGNERLIVRDVCVDRAPVYLPFRRPDQYGALFTKGKAE